MLNHCTRHTHVQQNVPGMHMHARYVHVHVRYVTMETAFMTG
jgi:hypothetical protein